MNKINELIHTTQNLIQHMDEIIAADQAMCERIRIQLEMATWDILRSVNDLNSIKEFVK
jgi:t-SNARE complex subunit (syntaxin)